MEKLLEITDSRIIQGILGVEDRNLHLFEKHFGVKIFIKNKGLLLKGKRENLQSSVAFMEKLIGLAREGVFFTREELNHYLNASPEKEHSRLSSGDKIEVFAKRKVIIPKTKNQQDYVKAIKNYDVTFAIGPAGTGKTYLAMAMAVNYLKDGRVRRIILTRPAIEAGESLGFLPGDMQEKLAPYLRPLYDALYDMMDPDLIEEYLETGVIEIAPLAYMRGRTLNNAFIILDEAQNCTSDQLKMFLTRLGFNSRTVITGDITQSDLPGGKPMGLVEATKILKNIEGIKIIYLSDKDVVRHPLIQEIVKAYENFYREK